MFRDNDRRHTVSDGYRITTERHTTAILVIHVPTDIYRTG